MLVRREAPRIPEANWCLSAFGMRLGKRSQDMALECIDLPCELPFISIGAASQRMSLSAGSRSWASPVRVATRLFHVRTNSRSVSDGARFN